MRLISVSLPGVFRASRRSTYSTAISGVVPGPILMPIGLDSSSTNAMCAPSSCRVRSPTQMKCELRSYSFASVSLVSRRSMARS